MKVKSRGRGRSLPGIFALLWLAPICATQLPVRIYTTADGMSRSAATCIVRDSQGFLWLCTREGVSRFDGNQFLNYGVAQGLPHRVVNDFLENASGAFFAATPFGISRMDPAAPSGSPHKFAALQTSDGATVSGVYALLEDKAGILWGGTLGGLYRVENAGSPQARLRFVDLQAGPERVAGTLAEAPDGSLWIGTDIGLCRRRADGRLEWWNSTAAQFPRENITSMLMEQNGTLWVGTLGGLWRVRVDPTSGAPAVEHVYRARDGLSSDRIQSLFRSANGTLWAGTAAALSELTIDRDGHEQFRNFSTEEGLHGRAVLALNEDQEGNLWAAVDHGLARILRNGFHAYTAAEGIGSLSIPQVSETPDGGIVAVSNQVSGILLHGLESGKFSSVRPLYPASMRSFGWGQQQVALLDRTGEWWIATAEGLCRFPRVARLQDLAHTPPKAIYTEREGLQGVQIYRIFEDSRGDIWITAFGAGGPARWERATGKFHRYTLEDVPGMATAYAEDRSGSVWIAFSYDPEHRKPGGLIRYRDGQFRRFLNSDGVPAGWISGVFVDRKDRLWVASGDGGLGRVDNLASEHPRFRTYTTQDGLSSLSLGAITEDHQGMLYATTARGVDRFDPETGHFQHFSIADGVPTGGLSSAFADRGGKLWFGSSMGLAEYVPQPAAGQPAPPRVYITGLTINGEARGITETGTASISGIRLEPDKKHLQIEFAAPSFGSPLRYQYMLEGAEQDWSAPIAQRTVHYANLSPGSYRFLVRAVTEDQAAGAQPAEIRFEILPPLWSRWWFVSLIAAVIATLAFGAHRYHLSRRLELEGVRARIAADLHDDIGASLSRVAILSEVLHRQNGFAHPAAGQRLTEIADTARGLVDGMSDIVWSIDPRRDDMRSLIRRVREFASATLEAQNIRWTLPSGPEIEELPLSPDQRRHLYLVVKEAIANAARHSGCTAVNIEIGVAHGECIVQVKDDGRGIGDSPEDSDGGNGLGNMRTRAAALHGMLDIATPAGGGTQVTLRFPLTRKFRTGATAWGA